MVILLEVFTIIKRKTYLFDIFLGRRRSYVTVINFCCKPKQVEQIIRGKVYRFKVVSPQRI